MYMSQRRPHDNENDLDQLHLVLGGGAGVILFNWTIKSVQAGRKQLNAFLNNVVKPRRLVLLLCPLMLLPRENYEGYTSGNSPNRILEFSKRPIRSFL